MTDKEELTRGDALARVAVLEAENAALRKRVCVPEGCVPVPSAVVEFLKGAGQLEGLWFGESGIDRGAFWWRKYLFAISAAPAPVESCDTCYGHGEVPTGETQRFGDLHPPEPIMMACPECSGHAPAERVEQEAKVFWVLFDATADVKYIKKDAYAGTLAFFDNESDAERAKRINHGTDYKRVEYYTAPQPAVPAPDVAGLVDVLTRTKNEIEALKIKNMDDFVEQVNAEKPDHLKTPYTHSQRYAQGYNSGIELAAGLVGAALSQQGKENADG